MRITEQFRTLPPRQRAWLPYIVLTGAVFAAYANVYRNEFVWDDLIIIIHNKLLQHWSDLPGLLGKSANGIFYRPVQMLLYFFVYHAFGFSKAAFHGLNVLLQAANACLVYRLGCRLGLYQRASFAAALLWGVHPLWSETVTYISGTPSLLLVFFIISGLLVLLADFKPRRSGAGQISDAFAQQIPGAFTPRKFWLASLFFILALGSKESAVVFPALVTFALFLVSKERMRLSTYFRTWPLWLLAAACIAERLILHDAGIIAFDYQDSNYADFYQHNIINRIITSLATLPAYFSLLVWPTGLHMDWHFPIFVTPWAWQVLAGILIVALSLLQIIRRRHGLPLTWGLLWFAAAISPNTGILMPINAVFAEAWIYLPTIGLSLGVAHTVLGWVKTFHSKKPLIVAAVLVALAAAGLGTKTYLQNELLRDTVSLFENTLKYHPESPTAHYELGFYYFKHDEYKKAEEQLRADEHYGYSLDNNSVISLHMMLAFISLEVMPEKEGVLSIDDIIAALPRAKDIPGAIEELKLAQKVDPHYYVSNSFLAAIYYYLKDKKQGDYYKALADKNPPKNDDFPNDESP